MQVNFKNILLSLLIVFITLGCSPNQEKSYEPLYSETPIFVQKKVYVFGVHPLHNPKRLFEVYQPMVDYINAQLKGSELRLEASRNYAAYDKKLFDGYFDFSLPNPYQTVAAASKGYQIFGKMADDENFRGIILVRKDSGIEKVTDLRGKTVSYPAPTALAATMMPQWYMHENGLDINHDITNSYVGSQESSILNVFLGKSAAASTWPPPWRAFIKERPEIAEQVEIKWETSHLPNNGLIVREDVPADLLKNISKIIFSLHESKKGKEILSKMELSKYEKAQDSTYDSVRLFLKRFEKDVRPIMGGKLDNE
ncbi:MAG: phosphonate transport system substrate-binding protein [Sulfurimonas sp.]|jgi:phosphonate transport system substrate-binding protein|uniref:phosphate/phosphite/phosphonate ABC transporter substrate-binding protein n=1 Tax=Sulfurimonas sp. TaxID=2022749 RepID=UPI0039E68CD1